MIKKYLFSGLILVMIFNMGSLSAANAGEKNERSVLALPNVGSLGTGSRNWETKMLGWDIQGQANWTFEYFLYSAHFLFRPTIEKMDNLYFGAGLGGFNFGVEETVLTTTVSYSGNGLMVKAFAGWEFDFGFGQDQSTSVELGFQWGSADYTYDYTVNGVTSSTTASYELPKFYFGAAYAFYYQ